MRAPWSVLGPSASVDSFSRQRVSEPKVLFNSDFAYDINPLFFSNSFSGTGSLEKTPGESSITLTTGGSGLGSGAVLSSKQYFRYEPGKGRFVCLSGILQAQTVGVTSRFGNYDANNGMFFEMDGTLGASVNQRSNTSGTPVDQKILQGSWNIDPMDGSGPSGITLDFSKTLVFWIDFQWLGSGRARFGFIVNGMSQACHEIFNDNFLTVPYMNQGDLPVRQEIYNTGAAAGATTSKVIVMVVINEGGPELAPSFIRFVANNASNTVAADGTLVPVISIRPKLTYAGMTNRIHNILELLGVACVGGNSAFYQLIYNGTLTGASFSSVNPNSGMNYDIAATAISGGQVVASGYATSDQQMISDVLENIILPFTLDFTGTIADTYTVVCTSVPSSTAATVSAIIGSSVAWDAVALIELIANASGINAVGGANNAAAGNVTTLSAAYAPTAGNAAVVMFQTSGTITGLTVKDNLGNALTAGPTIGELIAYYQSPVPVGVTSYTATWTTARHASIAVEEYSNVASVIIRTPNTASGTSALATIVVSLVSASSWIVVGFGNVASQTMTGTVGTQRQQVLGSATSAPITLMDATAVSGVANVVAKIAWIELR